MQQLALLAEHIIARSIVFYARALRNHLSKLLAICSAPFNNIVRERASLASCLSVICDARCSEAVSESPSAAESVVVLSGALSCCELTLCR
jgi:hypothetical protein